MWWINKLIIFIEWNRYIKYKIVHDENGFGRDTFPPFPIAGVFFRRLYRSQNYNPTKIT